MFFDKNYLELICSPDILIEDNSDMVNAIRRIDALGLRYEYEERAAILEYYGGLSRDEADRQALQEMDERIDRTKKI